MTAIFVRKSSVVISLLLAMAVLVSALYPEPSFIIPKDTDYNLKVRCLNLNQSLCSTLATCQMTMIDINGNDIFKNKSMTNQIDYINMTLNTTYTSTVGYYYVYVNCQGDSYADTRFVVKIGAEPTTAEGLVYTVLMIIGVVLLIVLVIGAYKIDRKKSYQFGGNIIEFDYGIYLKNGLWFLSWIMLIFVMFFAWQICYNVLSLGFMTNIFRMIFITLMILTAPLFIMIVALMLIKWLADIKLWNLSVRGLRER